MEVLLDEVDGLLQVEFVVFIREMVEDLKADPEDEFAHGHLAELEFEDILGEEPS